MGIMKKVAKGSLAISTMGGSLAVEKAINSTKGKDGGSAGTPGTGDLGWKARGANVTAEEASAGVLWSGMSHEKGRNAHVHLYADRIEREKKASRVAFSQASQDNEVIPIRSVTSVNIKKANLMLSHVLVMSAGGTIPFSFRHEDGQGFKNAIMPLVLAAGQPQTVHAQESASDKLLKLAQLRDAGVLTEDEFQAKRSALIDLI
jgi:hypothetical protein